VRYIDSDGRRKCRASHQPTRELARRYLVEIEARIARSLVGIPEPAPGQPTVAELCERYLTQYGRPRIKDLALYRRDTRRNLRRALPLVGSRPAGALTAQEVAHARDVLLRRYSAGSVKLCLSYLAAVYSWAVKQGIVPGNPLKGVERPASAASADFLLRDEIAALLQTARQQAAEGTRHSRLLCCCVHLAAYTGLRKGELLGLRWIDLDLTSLRLSVARSYHGTPKSGQTRHLRLPSACVPLLRDWKTECPATREGLVFPIERGRAGGKSTTLGLPKLLAAAGVRVPAHPWHTLRHTFASHFIMAGGNILTLQRILGHADLKMTLIYAHLAPDYLGQEMERIKY
jgi:integrase